MVKEFKNIDEGYWLRKIDEYRKIPADDNLLNIFLIKYLKVDEDTASIDACGLKRSLSYSSFSRLKKFVYFLENRIVSSDFNFPEEVEKFIKK